MTKRIFALAAALAAVTAASSADAACGPTYCPSYGQSVHDCPWKSGFKCRVDPVVKDNPSFSELSSLFDQVAQGPSKYGSLGWNYTLNLGDGVGKPYGPTKVPARFPCVLLKAISAHESVGWNQFRLPTGPVCTGKQQTIVACDCGYGLMQVTSGMNLGDTSSYDANRVAGDAAYNASVGSQILGVKWTVTPSVGDNRVDLIEDWYFATWAYNGLAFSNNPNNSKYPADRKPYRGSGGLSGGNYPYQEIIWGLVRVPYGALEGKGAGYKAYPISYPNRAEICASCGSPSADISDPSPTHDGNCSTGGPITGPGPKYELSTHAEGDDRFADGSSKAIVDHAEGDTWTVDLAVKNGGDTTSPNVDLGVWVEQPYLHATHWTIESDATDPKFTTNDADGRADQPPRDAPGQTATFHMNAFAIGETKRVRLTIKADKYSIGAADHPDVRFWVKEVEGVYSKADFDAKPTNPSGQTFNGGDLKAWVGVDVYSRTHWSFDGGTLEGWTGSAATTALDKTSVKLSTSGDDPQFVGPETSFDAIAFSTLRVRGSSNLPGKARVYFTTKDATAFDESRAVDFDLPAPSGGASGDVVVDMGQHPGWKGTITRLRIDPAPSGTGTVVFEDLQMAGAGGVTPAADDAGTDNSVEASGEASGACSCDAPGRGPANAWMLSLLGLVALRRRRRT